MAAPSGLGHEDAVISITSKWFCAGVVLDESGHVYRCAPILGYMKGWSLERVLRYRALSALDDAATAIMIMHNELDRQPLLEAIHLLIHQLEPDNALRPRLRALQHEIAAAPIPTSPEPRPARRSAGTGTF